MNCHWLSNISCFEDVEHYRTIESIEEDIDAWHTKKLNKAALSENGSHRNQNCSSAELSLHDCFHCEVKLFELVSVWIVIEKGDILPEVAPEDSDLNSPCSNKVIVPNGTPVVGLKEAHEETKTHKDHDVNVLELRIMCV